VRRMDGERNPHTVESPHSLMPHQMLPEHVGFSVEEHGKIQTVDPDWERIYADLDGPQPDKPGAMVTAAEGLHEILHWAWRKGNSQRRSPLAAFRSWLALSAVVDPTLFDTKSFRQLGQEFGCTRALLSKKAVDFSKRFGLHFRRQHNGQANMQKAMLLSHQKRKHNEATHLSG
jgi:hypothetical protein